MQDTGATFDAQLHQWVATYLGAPNDDIANTLFPEMLKVVRSMQEKGVLKPIIFYQMMMVTQALKTTGRISVSEIQGRIKKMLCTLYNENDYVQKLTDQVLSAILVADRAANANPNNAPLLNQLRGDGGAGEARAPRIEVGQPVIIQDVNAYREPIQDEDPRGPGPGPIA